MRVSPFSKSGTSSSREESTKAAGTIRQAARGFSSFLANSARELAPVAPSLTSAATASAERSKTTQECPARMRRLTMLAPIRPSPIIPNCIDLVLPFQPDACVAPYRIFRSPLAFDMNCVPRSEYPAQTPPPLRGSESRFAAPPVASKCHFYRLAERLFDGGAEGLEAGGDVFSDVDAHGAAGS